MMKNDGSRWQDHMEVDSIADTQEHFDRDYNLDELLPSSVLDDLFGEARKIDPIRIAVLLPDGTPFYTKGTLSQDHSDAINDFIRQKTSYSFERLSLGQGECAVFPIIHELEAIGYLVVISEKGATALSPVEISLGSLLSVTLKHLLVLSHKNLMTSGLHGRVVEESYGRLKEKATLLERSEEKYRKLAENLELEVEKKTREINQTQTHLMHQEKMASIGHLAAGVAHEINNPMGFISSNLYSLKNYQENIQDLLERYRIFSSELESAMGEKGGRRRILEALEAIRGKETDMDIDYILNDTPDLINESFEGAERIKKIIIDLKDFAHPYEDKLEYGDINALLDSTLNVIRNELKYKATVTKDYGELPEIKCYPHKLNQVFMNMLVNATQAIEERGDIKIITREDNGHIEIAISDTGSGIEKENISNIFDPFYTTKEVGKGTGLGLNVSYNIIEKHNGSIDVASTPGKGTTFTIRIPADTE